MGTVDHALGKKVSDEMIKLILAYAEIDYIEPPTYSDIERMDEQEAAQQAELEAETDAMHAEQEQLYRRMEEWWE